MIRAGWRVKGGCRAAKAVPYVPRPRYIQTAIGAVESEKQHVTDWTVTGEAGERVGRSMIHFGCRARPQGLQVGSPHWHLARALRWPPWGGSMTD